MKKVKSRGYGELLSNIYFYVAGCHLYP